MSTVIIDRVAVHGENGNVTLSRGRDGTFYLEARPHKGERVVVQLHRDAVAGEDGLLDQLQRFLGATPALPPPPPPEPEPRTFRDLLFDGIAAKGLSPTKFAAACDVSVASVTAWKSGAWLPRRRYLPQIAQALEIDLDTLIEAYARERRLHEHRSDEGVVPGRRRVDRA